MIDTIHMVDYSAIKDKAKQMWSTFAPFENVTGLAAPEPSMALGTGSTMRSSVAHEAHLVLTVVLQPNLHSTRKRNCALQEAHAHWNVRTTVLLCMAGSGAEVGRTAAGGSAPARVVAGA